MRIYGNLLEIQEMSVIDFGVSHVKGSKSRFLKSQFSAHFLAQNVWIIGSYVKGWILSRLLEHNRHIALKKKELG